jgi:hypothetical protein
MAMTWKTFMLNRLSSRFVHVTRAKKQTGIFMTISAATILHHFKDKMTWCERMSSTTPGPKMSPKLRLWDASAEQSK